MGPILSQCGVDVDDDRLAGSVDRPAVDACLQRLAVDVPAGAQEQATQQQQVAAISENRALELDCVVRSQRER